MKFSLRLATSVRLVIFLSAENFPCVKFSLKMFLLRHATVAWRDTFLQAAVNFLGSVSLALHVALQFSSCPYAASSVL
jgi:hypothetical protein